MSLSKMNHSKPIQMNQAKTYYLLVFFLLCAVASMRASQYRKAEELPLRGLIEDASIVAVVEFVYKLNGFKLVELLEPRPKNPAHKREILRNHFVEHEGQWIGAVSSDVNYRKDLLSVTGPRPMRDVPHLVFLRRTKDPNNFNRSVLGDGLLIPVHACSYQFVQGRYGAVPIVDLSPSTLSPEVRNAVEAMNKGQGWRTYSGDDVLDRIVRPRMMSTYGVYDGRLVYEAYRALFTLIGSSSETERASTYSENIDNPVFINLLGKVISNVEVNVEVGSNALGDSGLAYNISHSVINILEPEIVITDNLREYLNRFRIDELELNNVRLSVVLGRIERMASESGGGNASGVEFHLEPGFDPRVSPNFYNLKLGDLLYFFGVQRYLTFEKNGGKIKVRRL